MKSVNLGTDVLSIKGVYDLENRDGILNFETKNIYNPHGRLASFIRIVAGSGNVVQSSRGGVSHLQGHVDTLESMYIEAVYGSDEVSIKGYKNNEVTMYNPGFEVLGIYLDRINDNKLSTDRTSVSFFSGGRGDNSSEMYGTLSNSMELMSICKLEDYKIMFESNYRDIGTGGEIINSVMSNKSSPLVEVSRKEYDLSLSKGMDIQVANHKKPSDLLDAVYSGDNLNIKQY